MTDIQQACSMRFSIDLCSIIVCWHLRHKFVHFIAGTKKRKKKIAEKLNLEEISLAELRNEVDSFIMIWCLLLLSFLPHHIQMVAFMSLDEREREKAQYRGRGIVLLPHWIVRLTRRKRKEIKKNEKKEARYSIETWPMINEKFNATMTWIFYFSFLLVVSRSQLFYFILWCCRVSNSFCLSYFHQLHIHGMK